MPKKPRRTTAKPISLAAAARRRRWREEHARVVVDAWQESDLTMREFAGRHGLPQKRLERWSCKLRKKAKARSEAPLQFLPVEVTSSATAAFIAGDRRGVDAMELALPTGIRVTVSSGFDVNALKRLLGAVGC